LVLSPISKTNPVTKPYIAGIAIRDATVSGINAVHYLKSGEVVQGHGPHKLGSLSVALFAVTATYDNETATKLTGLAANTINAGLAIDYFKNVLEPHGVVTDSVRHIAMDWL
jgi:hypothetical protein